ncbi:unnamed protein product [Acanthoscelides obtectus]|uniref:Reverse transcriptase domain-containing protein n=1 Tax=Acanthoscelides obtectus TaxID=200917 RepID=A0A9P0PP60_ACAOB|nr:unnamed protein product [Acanthoscelides obtectus]CAK1660395.1 hypothetical protein AOBTE_LOCUS22039 [Acanthoscelides obtectus]
MAIEHSFQFGSVLAPTLFLLHINDLLSCTINPIHSFADDSTLHTGIKNLEAITAWGRNILVQFNASKTQYCTLTNKKRPSAHPITEDLIGLEHISLIAAAAGKKLGYLFGAKNLEYCSHVWGAAAPNTLSMLDAVQRAE